MESGRITDRREIRSIFVSDVHLGCRHSRAVAFLEFLREQQPKHLYIVGDFLDGTSPLRPGFEHVQQIGPLLRPEITGALRQTGDYLLSYLRPQTPEHVLDALRQTGRRVRIYGLGERPSLGPLSFHAVHPQCFVEDLAGCAGLVAASGNQLMGEALYLEKPVLAVPERNHHEQLMNAHFMNKMGGGEWEFLQRVTPSRINSFLERADTFRRSIATFSQDLNGTPAAVEAIQQFLP